MRLKKAVPLLATTLVSGALVASCSLTADKFSCAVSTGGARVRCVDYEDVNISLKLTVETLCRGIGGSFSTSKHCPDEGKVGGCRHVTSNVTQTSWYYTDSIAPTAAEAQGRCESGDTFLLPDGTIGFADMNGPLDQTASVQDLSLPPADLTSHD